MSFPVVRGRRCCTALALFCLASSLAHAQLPREPEVVVTATRTPLRIDEALSSVTLIDRATIEASGSLDLVGLLQRAAGVDVIRGGGLGSQTSVFMRGSNSSHVLVLIDGVRVASSTSGAYAWEHLALEQIERIEVVRGPRAALYGSDAIGGVVQIFTRRESGFGGTLGVGSHDTRRVDLRGGVESERGQLGAQIGYVDTRGFNAQSPQSFAFDPDKDGAEQRSLNLFGGYRWDALRFEGSLLHSDDDIDFDRGSTDAQSSALQLALEGGDEHPWRLAANAAREEVETADFFARFETRRRQLEAQQARRLGAQGQLLYGVSAVFEHGRSVDTFDGSTQYGDDRDHHAGFLAWRAGHGAFSWELAGRRDDYDSFGGETTGQAALGLRASDRLRLRASWGEGFRAPNLNELYSPGFGGLFAGNPALNPELARNIELGADLEWSAAWQFGLSLYRNRVRDLIDFSGGDSFQAVNIGRARLEGAEFDAQWRQGDWQLSGNLGWQSAENERTGSDLLRRAPRKANFALQRELGRWQFAVDLHAVSARPEFSGELPGYAVLGGRVGWQWSEALSLDLRIDNLFDRDYQLARGFNTPGSTALLQLRWSQGGAN